MRIFAAIACLWLVSACASGPSMRVIAETECVQEVTITSLVSEFGDGPVSGCGKRDYTGRFFLTGSRVEVPAEHIQVRGSVLLIAPEYQHLYGGGA